MTSDRDAPPGAPPANLARTAVGELIDELDGSGVGAEPGAWTLDAGLARRKLAEYQHEDARCYVLSLVRAAVLSGATRIDVTVDSNDVRFRFDGAAFSTGDLEHLDLAAYGPLADRPARARHALALGVAAALHLEPRYVRIRSDDGRTAAELERRPDRPDRLRPGPSTRPGTDVHVKARLLDGIRTLVRERSAIYQEIILLRVHGTFSPVPLVVNGRDVTSDRNRQSVHPGRVASSGEGWRCVTDHWRSTDPSTLHLHVGGVLVESRRLDGIPGGLDVFLDDETLRLDLSGMRLVEDGALARALARVPEIHEGLLAALLPVAREWIENPNRRGGNGWEHCKWAVETLVASLASLPPEAYTAGGETGLASDLSHLPLVPCIDQFRGFGHDHPLAHLMQLARQGRWIGFLPEPKNPPQYDWLGAREYGPIIIAPAAQQTFYRAVLGERLVDRTRLFSLLEARARALHRLANHLHKVANYGYDVDRWVAGVLDGPDDPGWHVKDPPEPGALLDLLPEGKRLTELLPELGALIGVMATRGDLAVVSCKGEEYSQAISDLVRALPGLHEHLVDLHVRSLTARTEQRAHALRTQLLDWLGCAVPAGLWRTFQIMCSNADFEPPPDLTTEGVHRRLGLGVGELPARADRSRSPIASVPLLRRNDGGLSSLEELHHRLAANSGPQLCAPCRAAEAPPDTLILDERELGVLELIFGLGRCRWATGG